MARRLFIYSTNIELFYADHDDIENSVALQDVPLIKLTPVEQRRTQIKLPELGTIHLKLFLLAFFMHADPLSRIGAPL